MKKMIGTVLASITAISMLAACGSTQSQSSSDASGAAQSTPASSATESSAAPASNFDANNMITVVSREDGSGTRGAFIELFGIEEKGADGTKTDHTTEETTIAPKTDVMLTNVAGDEYAIGYVSLGSLNDTVKALKIDGAEATAENVKAGTYKISRPFKIATKGDATGLAKDFIDFIMSKEGQEVISNGYIAVDDAAAAFAGSKPEGKLVVAGSSSVAPIMEKLAEAYKVINPAATIEIQQSDSTAGMTAAIDGTCDIGMASRDLKDSEKEALKDLSIAIDGIAVITSVENPVSDMTSADVKAIYTGETTDWSSLVK